MKSTCFSNQKLAGLIYLSTSLLTICFATSQDVGEKFVQRELAEKLEDSQTDLMPEFHPSFLNMENGKLGVSVSQDAFKTDSMNGDDSSPNNNNFEDVSDMSRYQKNTNLYFADARRRRESTGTRDYAEYTRSNRIVPYLFKKRDPTADNKERALSRLLFRRQQLSGQEPRAMMPSLFKRESAHTLRFLKENPDIFRRMLTQLMEPDIFSEEDGPSERVFNALFK